MKKLFFLFILTLALTHSHDVYALTYTRTPSGNLAYDTVTVSVSASDVDDLCGLDMGTPFDTWAIYFNDPWSNFTEYSPVYSVSELTKNYTHYFSNITTSGGISFVGTVCSEDNFSQPFENYFAGNQLEVGYALFTVYPYVAPMPQSTSIWNGDNGFWGSTTPQSITSSMVASVQESGANIWPLLALIGVPLAFLIMGFLLYFIDRAFAPKPVKGKVVDFDFKKADELKEFFSKTGDSGADYDYTKIKRKRGRPRKEIEP